jgi:hypothetical protein
MMAGMDEETIEVSRSDLAELLTKAPHEGEAWERLADRMLGTRRKVPLRNEHAGIEVFDMVLPKWPEPAEYWTPFRTFAGYGAEAISPPNSLLSTG